MQPPEAYSSSFVFVWNKMTEVMYGGAQNETFRRSFGCWSRSAISMQTWAEKILSGLESNTPAPVFVKQRVVHAVREALRK